MKNYLLSCCSALALLAFTSPVALAETTKPAVKADNGKIDVSGGAAGREATGALAGSYSVPIGHSYGIQVDAGVTDTASSHGGGLAAHFFKRDPDAYLLGVTSMWVRTDGRDILRNGLESEFYRDDVTLSLTAGLQNGLGRSTGYAGAEVGYYFTDDLYGTAGVTGYSSYRSAYVGAEYRPWENNSLSLFGNVGAGNVNGGFGILGIRYSFGAGNITLKKQHREYDPPNIIGNFAATGTSSSVNNTISNIENAAPAPVVVDGGEG